MGHGISASFKSQDKCIDVKTSRAEGSAKSVNADDPSIHSYFNLGLSGLLRETKFTKEELQRMYRAFKEECPRGQMTQDVFFFIFRLLFPGGDPSLYCNRIFLSLDQNRNGKITFEEFILGLSKCLHGNHKEKLRWAFEIYDIEGTGYLMENQLFCILSSIYSLIGVKICEEEEDALRGHTHELFQILDVDGDGQITEDEFVCGCLKDQETIDALIRSEADEISHAPNTRGTNEFFEIEQPVATGMKKKRISNTLSPKICH